jgi:two-component SAPR family response regulator
MELMTALIGNDKAHNPGILKALLETHFQEIKDIPDTSHVKSAYNKIITSKPRLVFHGIKMPGKSGSDLPKLFDSIGFKAILVSAFKEYALNTFEFYTLGCFKANFFYA